VIDKPKRETFRGDHEPILDPNLFVAEARHGPAASASVGSTSLINVTYIRSMAKLLTLHIFIALILALVAGFGTAVGSAAAQTLFEGARLIPGDGDPPIENSGLLVERGVIARIGRAGEIAAPGAIRIDLSGKTVMPAIISPHVHPGFQRGLTYSADNFTRETVLGDLNRALYFGISTVMSLGIEKDDVLYAVRADQAAGRLGGARLFIAGRGIGAPNAGPGATAFAGIAYEVTTEDQARGAARELAARNVDIIKIWVDDRGGRAPKLPIALARAVIEEGHRAGLKVAAHIFYHDDAVALAAAGVNVFAHLVRDQVMSDQLIAAMLDRHVYVMPNLGAPERATHTAPPDWFDEPYLAGMLHDTEPAEVIERVRQSFAARDAAMATRNGRNYAILERNVAKLDAAGAAIILGADTGLEDHFFGYAEQKELELMAKAGMAPAQVIVAATGRAADFMGLADRGTLTPGKRADFLVLDANPLDDIRNTRRIGKMYLAGVEVDRAALKELLLKRAGN
jgi:imidazolonepropionase-like amidohydrolase